MKIRVLLPVLHSPALADKALAEYRAAAAAAGDGVDITAAGIAALGPRHWGFDFDFTPIEALVA